MRGHKYNAKRTRCLANHDHASKKEARRCDELMLLFRAGQIQNLEIQPPKIEFRHNGVLVTSYRPDAIYFEGGVRIIEDVKGRKTPEYNIKKKLLKAFYNIEVREV